MNGTYQNDDLQKIIKNIAESGSVILTNHAKERMGLRGYTIHDVLHILLYGEIQETTEKSKGHYKCKIVGMDIEGESGAVVTEVVKKSKVIIITVLGGV